ncbi:response regulator [Nitrospira sp. Nam74]
MTVRLLLVDDDPFALQAVSHTLRHFLPTLSLETSVNPVSALLKLERESFAVVLSDFNMPDMNGLGLLRAAREAGSEASFILMTGDSTDDMLIEGLRLGIFTLVNKPLNRATFIPLVQQAIECYRLRQEVAELRRTLVESGLELGCLMRRLAAETDEVFQQPLPY